MLSWPSSFRYWVFSPTLDVAARQAKHTTRVAEKTYDAVNNKGLSAYVHEETMSRIHEALKKAAQERSLRLSSGTSPDFVDVATDISRTTVPAETRTLPSLGDVAPKQNSPFLSFEELVKKCAHPAWQIDPRIDVFLGADSNQAGAESFRTLRFPPLSDCGNSSVEKRSRDKAVSRRKGRLLLRRIWAQSIARQDHRRVLLIDGDLPAVASAPGAGRSVKTRTNRVFARRKRMKSQ